MPRAAEGPKDGVQLTVTMVYGYYENGQPVKDHEHSFSLTGGYLIELLKQANEQILRHQDNHGLPFEVVLDARYTKEYRLDWNNRRTL